MKTAVAISLTIIAAAAGQLLATYLVNNVRAVRDFTGPL
jgi:hypothetical protein